MRLPFLRRRPRAARAYARAKPPSPGTPWREARFAVVDLEMTGLDPDRDEIISFAAVPVEGGRVVPGRMTTTLVRPERMPGADTIRIHGLRPADLTDAPPLDKALGTMFESLAGRTIVAHPARIESAFLSAAFGQGGAKLHEPLICTATIAGRVLSADAPPSGEVPLADAVSALGLPIHDPHTAAGDALTTAQLFLALASRLERREEQTVGTLARLSGPRR